MGVRHATQATAPDSADEISTPEWNADHLVTSLKVGAVTATPAANQNDYSPTGWNDAEPAQSTVLRIAPTASIVITGLAGGASGRVAILRNDSTDRIIILPDQSTASSAANRFDLRTPHFLLPNASITLLYDATDSVWRPLAASGGLGIQAFFDFYEDFTGSLGGMASIVSGTGASIQTGTYLQNATEKPVGIWQVDTGTTLSGRAYIGSNTSTQIFPGMGQGVFLARVAVEALSNATERFQVFVGLHDATGAANVLDGVYWVYRDEVSAAWQGGVATNTTRAETGAAGPTVDTNYIWLGIYVDPAWGRATFFYSTDSVTWTIAGEKTSGLPTGSQSMGYHAGITKSVGTTQRNLSIDLIALRLDVTRG